MVEPSAPEPSAPGSGAPGPSASEPNVTEVGVPGPTAPEPTGTEAANTGLSQSTAEPKSIPAPEDPTKPGSRRSTAKPKLGAVPDEPTLSCSNQSTTSEVEGSHDSSDPFDAESDDPESWELYSKEIQDLETLFTADIDDLFKQASGLAISQWVLPILATVTVPFTLCIHRCGTTFRFSTQLSF